SRVEHAPRTVAMAVAELDGAGDPRIAHHLAEHLAARRDVVGVDALEGARPLHLLRGVAQHVLDRRALITVYPVRAEDRRDVGGVLDEPTIMLLAAPQGELGALA